MHPLIVSAAVLTYCIVMTWSCSHRCKFLIDKQYGGQRAMCGGQVLECIPTNLPRDITELNLEKNNLTNLPNYAFLKYPSLIFFNLGTNRIGNISKTAFKGLFALTQLNLENNPISENYSFPHDLFVDLHNLQKLNIEQNLLTSYPDWIFPPLINLNTLYIGSIPTPVFGHGFSKLVNLKVLKMDSPKLAWNEECTTERLTNETFYNFRNIKLETLLLNKCPYFHFADVGVLEPLMSLQYLELTHNHIGIHKALSLLRPFKGRHMRRIWLKNTRKSPTNKSSDMTDHILTRNSTRYLLDICVSEFSLSESVLTLIEVDTFNESLFQQCVVILDISKNFLMGNVFQAQNLSLFSNLRQFDLSYQRLSFQSTVPHPKEYGGGNTPVQVNITLPPNLEYLDLTGTLYFTGPYSVNVSIQNGDSLRTFLFGYNVLFNRISIHGLKYVTNLDLSGHNFFLVTKEYFNSYVNIRSLILKDCSLNDAPHFRTIFVNIHNLEILDVSRNNIRIIPIISNPGMITELYLSNNKFETVPLSLKDYGNLKLIDMSFNSIGQLSRATREALENAYSSNKLQLVIKGNTFSCGCSNLDFILWLMDTNVIFETEREFTCILDNGTITTTEHVFWNSQRISRRCSGKLSLTMVLALIPLLMLSHGIAFMLNKNPTRYWCLIKKLIEPGIKMLCPEDFNFTLYIGYSQADIPFVFRKLRPALENGHHTLRIYLKDREVLPGVDIADGIVEGINDSWKTLLVVSQDFLNDPWSNFTINTAVYSMTDLIPDRIIVLLVGDVQVKDLPESLLNAVDEDYIFGLNEKEDVHLWKRIREICSS